MPGIVGTKPNQVPTNGDLGPLAFRDENPVGDVVGTSDIQVLSGKSFSDNLLFTGNAVVGVKSAASSMFIGGGGTLPDNVTYQSTSNHIWQVGGVERARISSSGRVGVGTTSPQGQIVASNAGAEGLEIDSVAVAGASRILAYNRSALTENALQLRASAIVMLTDGAERLRIDAYGNLGLGVVPSAWGGAARAVQVGSHATLASLNGDYAVFGSNWMYSDSDRRINTGAAATYYQSNGAHYWSTAPSGAAGSPISFTQAMTLDASGNLLVGKTTSGYTLDGVEVAGAGVVAITRSSGTCIDLNRKSDGGVIDFYRSGSAVGGVSITTTATSYNTSSDYRLKNITGPVTNSGAYIDSLNPVEGSWKADGSTFVGLIAHEVQEASRTQVATGVKDGEEMQAMDYSASELIANMIAELKSLRARVAALENN